MKAEKQKDDEILEISIGRLDGDIDFIEIRAGTTVRELISTYKSLHPETDIPEAYNHGFVKTKYKLLFNGEVLAKKYPFAKWELKQELTLLFIAEKCVLFQGL